MSVSQPKPKSTAKPKPKPAAKPKPKPAAKPKPKPKPAAKPKPKSKSSSPTKKRATGGYLFQRFFDKKMILRRNLIRELLDVIVKTNTSNYYNATYRSQLPDKSAIRDSLTKTDNAALITRLKKYYDDEYVEQKYGSLLK
jgi:hypothetical protein